MHHQLKCHGNALASGTCPCPGHRGRQRIAAAATLLSRPSKTSATVVTHSGRAGLAENEAVPSLAVERNEPIIIGAKPMRRATPVTVATLNDVRTMFASLLKEYAYWVDETWVTGTIPRELCGTYYRNGPALQVTNPRYRRHTLDGDGMIFSVAFKDGRAYFRNRFVRTKGFVEEQAAGRPLYRNSFTRGSHDGSTPWFNPFDLSFKNVANTGVLPWAGQLYALWEAGLPYLMDPTTLETFRETRMGGQIRSNSFSAHYRIVTETHGSAAHQRAAPRLHHTEQHHGQERQPGELQHQQHHHQENQHHQQQHQQQYQYHQQQHQHQQHHYQQQHHHQQHQQQHWRSANSGFASAAAAASAWAAEQPHDVSSGNGSGDGVVGSSSRRLVSFSNEYGYSGASVVFYEFDESGQLLHETRHPLPGIDIALIHDMVVTEHYYVLVMGPIRVDPLKFVTQYALGLCSIAELMVFDPTQPTRIMMFPRPGRPSGEVLPPRVLTTEPLFVFHNVNGWEEELEGGGRRVVLDCVAWDQVSFDLELFDRDRKRVDGFVGGARTQLTRLSCDLRTGAVERRKLLQRTVEFPATDPRVTSRPHRVSWFIADAVDHPVLWGPAQGVVRVQVDPDTGHGGPAAAGGEPSRLAPPAAAPGARRDGAAGAAAGVAVDAWYFDERTFPGEPMFVPRPGSSREGDGWLIVGVHHAETEKADVHVFDAEDLSAGPICTLHLPHRLPFSLHGAWDTVYRGPDPSDTAVPRWQELGSVKQL